MPIIGTLTDFPLPEVIHFIGNRKGILRLLDLPNLEPMEMELFRGNLCSLQNGSKYIGDPQQVTHILSSILKSSQGVFEFSENDEPNPHGSLRIPVTHLMMDVVLMADELNVLQR